MKSLTPPILPKVPALRSAASQSCELRLQFFWTSEKEVEIFNNGWGVQNKQRDPLFTSRIPSPASSSLPIPISDLFTQIHLTFVWFVCLEFFYFFTSRIVDFCWLPFIFTLVHIRSVLISYHVCFTLLRFHIQRSQSLSLFPNKVDHSGFFFRYSLSLLHIRHFFNCNIFSCRSKHETTQVLVRWLL